VDEVTHLSGLRLQRARHKLGWTTRELADLLGVSVSAIEDWESGRTPVGRGSLVAAATTMGLELSDLLGDAAIRRRDRDQGQRS
jgi:transcriptional regulator with XRE-family HTH domain